MREERLLWLSSWLLVLLWLSLVSALRLLVVLGVAASLPLVLTTFSSLLLVLWLWLGLVLGPSASTSTLCGLIVLGASSRLIGTATLFLLIFVISRHVSYFLFII